MPYEWNNIWVVTQDELVPRFYNSLKTLQSEIHRYKNERYGIKKVQSGGNGRQMLVNFHTLSNEIQNAIGDPSKHNHILERFYKTDETAVTFFTDEYKTPAGAYLSLPLQEEYITNASVLKACIALKAARETERQAKGKPRGMKVPPVMTTVYTDALSFNETLYVKHQVRHTLDISEKRFKEYFKKFLNAGATGFNYACLVSGKVANNNAKVVSDELVELLNNMFAGQGKKPTRTEVSRQYEAFLSGYLEVGCNETGEIFDPKMYKPISEKSIIAWLGKWEHKIGTYAKRSGDRQKLMSWTKPYHSLERPVYAGSLLSIDDRQPPFEYAKGERVWFYNAIDVASDAFVCWVHGKSKEGIIIEFYRQLVRNFTEWGFNLPLELEAESNLNSSFQNTFLRPGAMFKKVRIEANNARGKYIERRNGMLRYGYEKEQDGWKARPHARSESNQKGAGVVPMLPYTQIVDISLKGMEDYNNSPHEVHANKTRWEVFCEMQNPNLEPTNWKSILPSLGFATKTSCNAGIINLQKEEFLLGDNNELYTGERLIELMKRVEGRDVTAYWLDGNNGKVLKAIIFIGDTCICEAIPKPRYNRAAAERTPQCEHNRSLMSAYSNTIESYMRERMRSIKDVTIIDHRETTLNRKFVMPGLKKYEEPKQETEVVGTMPTDEDDLLLPPTEMPTRSLYHRY